jgi:hypothetical protein
VTVARVRRPASCSICGHPAAAEITRRDRSSWPDLAGWVRTACTPCRRRLDRSAANRRRRDGDA